MIIIEKDYRNINIKLELIEIGNDICIIISGGDRPHIGAISIYSKEEGIQTISLKNHKDYIIGEMCINNIKDMPLGNISVSSGIHLDDITKNQIDDVYKICNSIFKELKKKLLTISINTGGS
ncbi:hypothetical protein ACQPUZ_05640 [Clostridium tertium]